MNLYIGNLPAKLTESELEDLFKPFGEVKSVKIIKDYYSGQSKGFGFKAHPQKKRTGGKNSRRW